MKSINTILNNIYKETLAPYGFQKIKGKYPYFVRLIGDEIVHVITYKQDAGLSPYYKEFVIECGVATVYRRKINFDISPKENGFWLYSNASIYSESHSFGTNDNKERCVIEFEYEVNNLEACVDFYYQFNSSLLTIYADEDFGNKWNSSEYNEGLLNTIVYGAKNYEKYVNDFREKLNMLHNNWKYMMKTGKTRITEEEFEEMKICNEQGMAEQIEAFKKLVYEPEWIAKVDEELKYRKNENMKLLYNYGIRL